MGSLPFLIILLTGGQEVSPAPDPQAVSQAPAPQTFTPTNPAPPTASPAPITGMERLDWTIRSTLGPASLLTGLLSAGWGTGFDHPKEYGVSVSGFAQRYGLRMTGVASSNVAEATLGTIWREDPRYHRDPMEESYGKRFARTLKMTFMSDRDGSMIPAYARYIAIAGTNVLSDTWRPNSDRGPGNTLSRIGLGFGGRLLGNMWEEFWPDVRTHLPFFNKH
jgi:hypothetical protein